MTDNNPLKYIDKNYNLDIIISLGYRIFYHIQPTVFCRFSKKPAA